MSKVFKIGDKVVSKGKFNSGLPIKEGQVYTVSYVKCAEGSQYISLKEIENYHSYSAARFVSVKAGDTEDYQVTEEQEAVLRLLRASLCGEQLKFLGHDNKHTDLCRLAEKINSYVPEVAAGRYTIVPKVNPEIARIEAEMRKLADELSKLKGDNL